MRVYRFERCRDCNYKRRANKPGQANGLCPNCGTKLYYSKNFYFTYYINGKKLEKSAGPDKKVAQEAEWKMKINVLEGKACTPTSWKSSVEELERTYRMLSPKTVEMYRNSLKNLSPYFGSMNLPTITERDLTRYKDARLQMGLSGSSFNRDRSTLKRMFALAGVEWRFRKSIFTAEKENVRDRFLSEEERFRLIESCKKRNYLFTIILLALNTGLRKTSILTLTWKDINFEDNIIVKAGKGDKISRIPMTNQLRKHLLACRLKQGLSSQHLFPSALNLDKPMMDISKAFKSACREALIPNIRFHDLRRSFATSVLAATGDLTLVQNLLSHSDINITRRHYAHTLDSSLHEGIKVFENYLGEKGGRN